MLFVGWRYFQGNTFDCVDSNFPHLWNDLPFEGVLPFRIDSVEISLELSIRQFVSSFVLSIVICVLLDCVVG